MAIRNVPVALAAVITLMTAAPTRSQPVRLDVGPAAVPPDGASVLPVVSFDGRYTAFVSMATNLVAGDTNGHADFFRYDRVTGQLARGALAPPLAAGEYPFLVAISHDGRWLLFNHGGADWVPGDTNGTGDVFLYDFSNGAVERLSVATAGGQANGLSFATSMTPDARYVAFQSEATNLGPPGPADVYNDVFVRDRLAATTTQVSRGHDGQPVDGSSIFPQLSPDGAWLAFVSYARNLTPAPESETDWDAYLAVWQGGATTRIHHPDLDAAQEVYVAALSWNAASATLAWFVPGSGPHSGIWDRLGGSMRRLPEQVVASLFTSPALSVYGRYVSYSRFETVGSLAVSVVRHDDLHSGESRVLASGVAGPVAMSLDGAIVVYGGDASGIYLIDTSVRADGRWPWGDLDGDGLANAWEQQFGLDETSEGGDDGPLGDPDHDGVTNLAERAAGTHPKALETRYLAEGVQNAFFATRIALLNPGITAAHVLVRFLRDDATTASETLVVPPHTRATILGDAVEHVRGGSFSAVVDADVPILVDRTTTWDTRRYGGTSESAVSTASTTWYFAEGATGGQFDLFYLLENPNSGAASVTVRWMRPAPLPPVVHAYTLPPLSRTTLYVDEADPALANADLAASLEATLPIFAERAMYWSRPGEPFAAGHGAAGVTAPATAWVLGEGATGGFFDTFILLLNPGDGPADCLVIYLRTTGDWLVKEYVLPPRSRTTIWVDIETIPGHGRALANAAFGTLVMTTNGSPIVVERAMWWPDGDWREAHVSPGATAVAPRWAFADGDNVNALTYVLLANTWDIDGVARVTLFFEDGSTAQTMVPIGAHRRVTIDTAASFPASVGRRFGGLIESMGVDAQPPGLVVERVTYWDANGVFWAGGTGALATPVP
jgi:hypothetical protein